VIRAGFFHARIPARAPPHDAIVRFSPNPMHPTPLPSAAVLRAMFRYDPVRGRLYWRRRADRSRRWNTRFAGKPAGCVQHGFIRVYVPGCGNSRAHRIIWKMVYDEEAEVIDHVDGDPANNRLSNLRRATRAQNNWNRRRNPRFRSRLRGVRPRGKRWVASIAVNGRSIFLGQFDSAADAYFAYARAARRYHGDFARLD
jgi:hypothetical protein